MLDITHTELVTIGAKWLHKKAPNITYRCQYVVPELVCMGTNEIPDVFGLRPNGHVLIEVKVSKRDFLNDFKKLGRNKNLDQLGNYRFYLTPKGLLDVSEIPEKWGLLEYDGKKVAMVKDSERFAVCDRSVHYVYHSILRRITDYQIFDFRKGSKQ